MIRFCIVFAALTAPCFGRLIPYSDSLDAADAVAVVTVISCEQTLRDGLIYDSATLKVEVPVKEIEAGETFKQQFGVPSRANSSSSTLRSDSLTFSIAGRYLALINRRSGNWVISRASPIVDGIVMDGYFEDFAKAHEIRENAALDFLRAHFGERQNRQSQKNA